MSIEIKKFRLSFIWIDINTLLLGNPDPPVVPMGFLGYRGSYSEKFEEVLHSGTMPEVTVPWGHPRGQHFWEYYLNRSLQSFDGDQAWKYMVPFRLKIPIRATASWFRGYVIVEAFLYPFGSALLFTVTSNDILTLRDTVDLAFKIKEEKFSISWPEEKQKDIKIYQLAEECIDYIRKKALGPNPSPSATILNDPFSIFTVIEGKGIDFSQPIIQNGEVHCALEAVTSWNQGLLRSWIGSKLPKLDESVMLPLRAGCPPSHLVYAKKRGRAVWFPLPFTDDRPNLHSLSCYHRNLLFLTMQVASFCSLAKITAKEIEKGFWNGLPSMHKECARIIAGILGRMFGKVDDTYRSMSPRYYIKQNGFIQDIDKIRNQVDYAPLKEP